MKRYWTDAVVARVIFPVGAVDRVLIYGHLLSPPEPKIFTESSSAEPKQKCPNRQATWVFVVQHTSHRPLPSDFECRYRAEPMMSQLMLNYRIRPENRVIIRYYQMTETLVIEKYKSWGSLLPGENSCHNQSTTMFCENRALF